jgi:TolB-like protein/Flp pilus assembly protein TadD
MDQSSEGIAAEESPLDVLPNSIAVLPFENLSPDPDNAYFAAGIHESTLNELSKIDDLAVMSRSSVLQYAENRPPIRNIAKELNVEVVMEGSVRYADGRVLITAQLIDGRTDEHIWSDEFEEELTDVFKVQREIAVNIANAMHLELLPEVRAYIGSRPTTSPKAYQHFLQALSFPSPWIFPEHRPAIIEALKDAIAIDDEFAEAYGWLADAYYSPPRDRELAVEFARKALALDEDNARAYVVLGMEARYYFDRLDEARYYFERAIELAPNQTSSMQPARHLAELDGSYSRSIQLFRRLIAQHPDFPPSRTMLGFLYLRSGNLSAAREQTSLAIRLLPGDYNNYSNLAAVEYLRGDLEAARHNLNRAITLMSPSAVFRSDYIAYLFGLTGDTDRAYSLLSQHDVQLDDPQNAAWETLGWAVLGTRDKDRALEVWQATINGYLDEGKPVSSGRITRFRDNWLNDPMLEEPEFIELRRRLGYEG